MHEPPSTESRFGSFYQLTLTPLRRYLTGLLGSSHEAQDIAHDAYLRTYEAMQVKTVNQPKAFLFTTAQRLALNFKIRRGNRMQPEDAAVLETRTVETTNARTITIARHEKEALEAAILALPEGCRTVLILRNAEEMSHQEIASRLGISKSTVEKQLSRALRLLRAHLLTHRDDVASTTERSSKGQKT